MVFIKHITLKYEKFGRDRIRNIEILVDYLMFQPNCETYLEFPNMI